MPLFWRDKKQAETVNDHDEEIKQLKARIAELKKEKMSITEELETVKFKKRLEQEEIVHLQRINEERLKQDVENEKIKIEKKYQSEISTFKEEQRKELVNSLKQFHVKMEERFKSELETLRDTYTGQLNQLKELYSGLMKVLPNVNLEITKHIGDAKYIETSDQHKGKR